MLQNIKKKENLLSAFQTAVNNLGICEKIKAMGTND